MMIIRQLALLFALGSITFGSRTGAPSISCLHMVPGHTAGSGSSRPIIRQRGLSPYKIEAKFEPRSYVSLTITGQTVAGFLIQARQKEDGSAIGMFQLPQTNNSVARHQDCTERQFPPHASITHKNPSDKSNLKFLWKPPKGDRNMNVTFYATLAVNYDMFWVMLPSNEINLLEMPKNHGTRMPKSQGNQRRPLLSVWPLSSVIIAVTMVFSVN